jgi:hypothetical protein
MVGIPAPIVAHRRPDISRDLVDVAQNLLNALILPLGVAFQRLIQVVGVAA